MSLTTLTWLRKKNRAKNRAVSFRKRLVALEQILAQMTSLAAARGPPRRPSVPRLRLRLFWVCALAAPRFAAPKATINLAEAERLRAEGEAALFQQDFAGAAAAYRASLALNPTFRNALTAHYFYNNLGWSMYHMGEWGKAEEHYKHALRASPQPPPTDHAYINLATLHKAENRIKPTIKAYRAAVALTHQSPTWAQLGWALLQDFQLDV